MARIEILKDVVINTGHKLFREDTIRNGTKAFYDFRSKWSGAGVSSNVAANTEIKNLAEDQSVKLSTLIASSVNAKGAVNFTKTQKIFNPAANNFPSWGDDNWLVQGWFKLSSLTAATAAPLFCVSNGVDWDYNNAIAAIYIESDSSGNYSHCLAGGLGVQLLTSKSISDQYLPNFNPFDLHLYSLHQSVDPTTNQIVMSLYIDGELVRSNTASRAPAKTLNHFALTSGLMSGEFYRYRYDNLSQSNIEARELINIEYAKGLSIYSS